MRKRLSWDKEKVAEIDKQADPYTMNQNRTNPPVEKYQTGDPSAWAEDPHMATPWKTEGRTETGHPAPAREAVKAARKMEDKALKCITIAQRMLPTASDELIEEQATDLMYLPQDAVLATIQRQASLAEKLAGKSEKVDSDEDDGEAVEAKEEKAPEAEAEEEEEEEKAASEEVEAKAKKEEKAKAKKEEKAPVEEEEVEEEEEVVEAAKKEEKAPEAEKPLEVEASSDGDALDQIFQQEITASEEKAGAKKLIVKQASDSGDPLTNMWDAPPDVSKAFK